MKLLPNVYFKCSICPFSQAPLNITRDQGTFDDLTCPVPTQIDIMGAWFRDTGGRVCCTLSMAEVDAGYYDDIISKCDGRHQCDSLDVRVGGTMWCPECLFLPDIINDVIVQYRCLQPPPGTVQTKVPFLTSKFCLRLKPFSRYL